jgi:hypothetical protein
MTENLSVTDKLKEAMNKIPVAEMQKIQKAMNTIGLLLSLMPDMEIKEVNRTFKNKDPAKPDVVKPYIVIYIAKPQKAQ